MLCSWVKLLTFTVSLLLSKSINGYWQNVREAMMKCWGLVSDPWGSGDALSYLARVQS